MDPIKPKINLATLLTPTVGEDHLGIKYVAINIADLLQPGITSVTRRARYWSFYAWVLYDFINTSSEKNPLFIKSLENFKNYLKRQECYFICANIAMQVKYGYNIDGLQGVTLMQEIWNESTNFIVCHTDYLQNSFGGYSIYRNVMKTTGVTDSEDNENGIFIDCLRRLGQELAIAFESEICETEYYKKYRHSSENIPKSVLIEFGKKAALQFSRDAKDLPILKSIFVPYGEKYKTCRRAQSIMFYKYALEKHPDKISSRKFWAQIFYDVYSPKGEIRETIPEEFKEVALGWEIFQARQLFTYGLEGIWSFVLKQLMDQPLSRRELFQKVINLSEPIKMDSLVRDLINDMPISMLQREKDINEIGNNGEKTIISALRLMLDVRMRFFQRNDLNTFHEELLLNGSRKNLSLHVWFQTVDYHADKTIEDILLFIFNQYIINQHINTTMDKLLNTGNITFHLEEDEGLLHFKIEDHPAFNVYRTIQAVSIAKDLSIID